MKYLSKFNSFLEKVGETSIIGKDLEWEFKDIEDYFTDFFDLSNDEWAISVQESTGTTLKIKIIKNINFSVRFIF